MSALISCPSERGDGALMMLWEQRGQDPWCLRASAPPYRRVCVIDLLPAITLSIGHEERTPTSQLGSGMVDFTVAAVCLFVCVYVGGGSLCVGVCVCVCVCLCVCVCVCVYV